MTGTWAAGWATNDVVSAAEFAKGVGNIYDTTLGGSAASIDVTSITGVYAHLKIVGYLRSDNAVQNVDLLLRFNGDTGANYGYQLAVTNGSGTNFNDSITATSILGVTLVAGASSTAGVFSPIEIVIPHYAGSANSKCAIVTGGNPGSTAAATCTSGIVTGAWRSSSAINRVTVSLSAGNIVSGSRLSIYAMGS